MSFEMKLLSLKGDGIEWRSWELRESEVSYAGGGQGERQGEGGASRVRHIQVRPSVAGTHYMSP